MKRTRWPKMGKVVDFTLAKQRRQPNFRRSKVYRLSLLFITDQVHDQDALNDLFRPVRALPRNWEVPRNLAFKMCELIAKVVLNKAVKVKIGYSNFWDEEEDWDEAG